MCMCMYLYICKKSHPSLRTHIYLTCVLYRPPKKPKPGPHLVERRAPAAGDQAAAVSVGMCVYMYIYTHLRGWCCATFTRMASRFRMNNRTP